MNFREWLLNEGQNIRFGSWWKDGTIIVYIDSTRYVFVTDALYHRQLQKLARFKPWTALNKIKEMVKNKAATQIEPPPQEKLPQDKPPIQGTLF